MQLVVKRALSVVTILLLFSSSGLVKADVARVAVATNFIDAARALAELFEHRTGKNIELLPGSTGKHYAQIIHGAPYDLFLAADSYRPEQLERQGRIQAGSRFTYAVGRLVLWYPKGELHGNEAVADIKRLLSEKTFRHIAVANARLAPYGLAAKQFIVSQALWNDLKVRLVIGENVGQAYHFVESGNAEIGFVAYSQLMASGVVRSKSDWWLVPESLYQPIEQQAVLLSNNPLAKAFFEFLKTEESRQVISAYGYMDKSEKRISE